MSHSTEEAGHGHSIAAWTTVIVIIVAFSIRTFFFFLEHAPAGDAGAALAGAGGVGRGFGRNVGRRLGLR